MPYFITFQRHIPLTLVITRFLLGLVLLVDALDGATSFWFAVGLSIGLLSDIIDGIIARRVGVVSPQLRDLDSRVDVFFLACIALSAWIAHRDVIASFSTPIIIMLLIYAISILVPLIKFQRLPSYHAFSAKLSGLALFFAAIDLFTIGRGGLLLWIAIIVTLISHLDRIVITVILPRWQQDVAGVWQAREIRANDKRLNLSKSRN